MFLVLAIDCGKPNVPNTDFDEEAPTTLHSVVELKCKAGFSRDEVEVEHISCQESGEWTTLPVCKGNLVNFDTVVTHTRLSIGTFYIQNCLITSYDLTAIQANSFLYRLVHSAEFGLIC